MQSMGPVARNLALRAHFGDERHVDALDTLYFGLYAGHPFDYGSEPAHGEGGYARVAVGNNSLLWDSLAGLTSVASVIDIVWPESTAAWSITWDLDYWAIHDSPDFISGADPGIWYAGKLPATVNVNAAGTQPRIPAGGLILRQGG